MRQTHARVVVASVGYALGAAPSFAEVVRLVHALVECALIKAKIIVLFPSIGSLVLRDTASDFIGISQLVVSLVVRRLEVVIDEAALLLLSQCEVVSLQLCHQVNVSLVLGALALQVSRCTKLGSGLCTMLRWAVCRADGNI